MKMVVEVPTFAEKLLLRVAKRGGKTPQEWVREVVLEAMEDAEDVRIAENRLRRLGKCYTQEEIEQGVDLED